MSTTLAVALAAATAAAKQAAAVTPGPATADAADVEEA